ncbi:hypothetical protein FOIG_04212 [Fusarium odoratissimum NRRL 54006]|uniref:Uncharacterized protein n=2 Tax=Fusarium oxysporum species complex TaxID=171631 RepID=X0LA18_FUSO5|nr:uncharacterized protein FOIG_04212 [Fusarium odoratissimum NRRL 54006]EXM05705.1 hypothetical protein FOIG_04212 [Fusarium odoratissimum NRRL 54006]TXC00257.1 hypothetical protein FocTR4_00014220 [Fusarium oxysporum f. sp. cubense]
MPIGQRKVRRFACWQGVYSPLEAIGSEVGARLELCGGKVGKIAPRSFYTLRVFVRMPLACSATLNLQTSKLRLTKFEDQLSMEIGGWVPVEVLASDPPAANLAPLHRGREH